MGKKSNKGGLRGKSEAREQARSDGWYAGGDADTNASGRKL